MAEFCFVEFPNALVEGVKVNIEPIRIQGFSAELRLLERRLLAPSHQGSWDSAR